MTHLNTEAQQIPMTLSQLPVPYKLTKETSQKKIILGPSYSSDII